MKLCGIGIHIWRRGEIGRSFDDGRTDIKDRVWVHGDADGVPEYRDVFDSQGRRTAYIGVRVCLRCNRVEGFDILSGPMYRWGKWDIAPGTVVQGFLWPIADEAREAVMNR